MPGTGTISMKGELKMNQPVNKTDRDLLVDWPQALRAGGPGPGQPVARTLTVPAGRFLIDLPGDASVHFGRQGFNEAGPFIQAHTVPEPGAAKAMVEAQAASLWVPHEEGGTRLERLAQGRRPHSWFIYFWKDTVFKDEPLELNGYFWVEGLLFIFRNTCGADPVAMAERAGHLDALFGRMRRRSLLELPPEPGFCLRDAYFPGQAARFSDEHIELLAHFPSKPGLSLRLRTDTVGEAVAHYPPLLERDSRQPGRKAHGSVKVRARERPVGPFPGQELVTRVSGDRGAPGLHCAWECLGRPRDPLAPMLVLELRTAGRTSLDERETLERWDAALGSLRRRENFFR
jgi:hypothetical protein